MFLHNIYKNKGEISYILLTIIVVVSALLFLTLGIGPKILELVKLSPGIDQTEANTLNKEDTISQSKKEINGQLKPPLIVKMEETAFQVRPTSKDQCLVGTSVKNTGEAIWSESDKIRISLFCNYQAKENQIKSILPVQNNPYFGYLTGLKPGEEIAVTFSRAPNNCLESLDTYKIILYSNCEGSGNQVRPCDNFESTSNSPKIISEVTFKCPIS